MFIASSQSLTHDQMLTVYAIVRRHTLRAPFKLRGASRNQDDGEEALHEVSLRLLLRVEKHWDRIRPLEAYVGAAVPDELRKYQQRQRRHEIPQAELLQC